MKILVTGASGFIGSQIIRDLLAAGHEVTCCARNINYTQQLFPQQKIIYADFLKDTSVESWLPRLKNIDVVINAVGIFYHPLKKNIWKIHYDTPKALFDACATLQIKKIIHLSALGIDTAAVDYAQSKKAAEDFLLTLNVPAFIIRPSLVYGKEWNGGMAMLLSLASLPLITPLPGEGTQQFQPIYVNDLSAAITHLVDTPLQQSTILHSVSHDKINLTTMLKTLRAWLQLAPAKLVHVPLWLIRWSARIGDFLPGSVLNTTAYQMMMQNNVTTDEQAEKFSTIARVTPRSFNAGVFDVPSRRSDKWQARLFILRPLAKLSLAFMWIASALCSAYLYPVDMSYAILAEIGVQPTLQPWLLYGASFINLLLGIGIFTPFVKIVYWLQLLTIITYTTIITFTLPAVWVEPFGSVVKNIPIIMLIILLMNVED